MADFRMIKLDSSDFEAILFALGVAAEAAGDRRGSIAVDFDEIANDIREQWHRNADEWGWSDPPTDPNGSLVGSTFHVAEDDFIQAGIDAREHLREHNRKAFREFEAQIAKSDIERPFADSDTRTARLFRGTITATLGNDPIDW